MCWETLFLSSLTLPHILLVMLSMQSPNCSLFGPFLRVVLALSILESWGNVSRQGKEQIGLLFAMKRQAPQAQCSFPITQPTVCPGSHLCPSGLPLMRLEGKTVTHMILILLAVLWIIKSFVSDPGVSCLLLIATKQ